MSKKLLLADDSITIQKVIGITFANEEYDLTIVDNGASALEKARADRPDLILSDVFMPGKNGYELAAAVKQDPSLKGVPVLLLAGTFEPFDEDKASRSGADGWISKPFESQALIDQVEELLARGAAAPSPEPAVEMPPAGREEEPIPEWGEAVDLDEESYAGDDDLWGAVSFAEEDLGDEPEEFEEGTFVVEEEPSELAGVSFDISEASEEEDFLFTDEPLDLAESPIEETALSLTEEEPFDFEDEPLDLSEETPADQGETAAAEEEGFVFEEDPLDLMEEPPAGEQAPEEKAALPAEGEAFVWEEEEPAEPQPATAWEEPEEDVFVLEEADILEEEELETESIVAAAALTDEEEEWETEWEEDAAALAAAAEEDIFAEPEPEMPAAAAAEGEFPLGEEGPEWGIAEPGPEGEEASAAEEEAAPVETPSPLAGAAATESVAGQVQALSEEDLARLVEKVAGTVIERMAGSILEKIAWEVVPDLAESMIRDELRRLKGEAEG